MKENLSESRIDYEEAEEADFIPPNFYKQPPYPTLLPSEEILLQIVRELQKLNKNIAKLVDNKKSKEKAANE